MRHVNVKYIPHALKDRNQSKEHHVVVIVYLNSYVVVVVGKMKKNLTDAYGAKERGIPQLHGTLPDI